MLFLIFSIALFLRFYRLDFQSFWYEELMSLHYSKGDSILDFFQRYHRTPDASPPLYSFLIFLLRSLHLNSDWFLRFPSVIFGIGAVVMTFFLGKRLANETTGMIAALLCAGSGSMVYYSQELRYNSCLVFFILTFTYFFIDFHDHKGGNKVKILLLINIIILTFLHYLGILFILELLFISALFRLRTRKDFIKFFVILLFMGIIFYPWVHVFWRQLNTWTIVKPINLSPHLLNYFYSMLNFAFLYKTYWQTKEAIDGEFSIVLTIFCYSLLCLCFGMFIYKAWKKRKEAQNFNFNQALLWGVFLGNILLFFLLDMIGPNRYFYEKNLLFTLPFLYLLVAYVFSTAFSRKESLILGAILFSMLTYRPFISHNYYNVLTKTEFRQTAELIASDPLHHPVLVMCGDERWYDYYFNKLNITKITFVKDMAHFESLIEKNPMAWVTFSHCFMDFEVENKLDKYPYTLSYKTHTLAVARHYNFRQTLK